MIFCAAHKNEPEAMNMEKRYPETTQQGGRVGVLISRLALMLALAVLVLTVRTCCPGAVQRVKDWLGLGEDGRTRAAFSALSGALSEGDGVVAAFAESYQTLAGETP